MSAYVVVQLAPGRRARDCLARRDVERLLREHHAQALPETAGDDPLTPLTIAIADMSRAERLAAALRALEGVAAAYAKPGEELP